MKRILLFVIFLTSLLINLVTAQNGENPFANFEPTVFPDRIMLAIPGDPANSRAVTWRTSFEVTTSAGEIAILDASPKFDDKIKIAAGSNSPWEEGSQAAMGHKIIFENLQPETKPELLHRLPGNAVCFA